MAWSNQVKAVVARVVNSGRLAAIGQPALHAAQFVMGLTQREVVSFAQPARAAAATRLRQIVTGFPTQTVSVDEAFMIRSAVLATAHVPGVLAEVGVFRGGTARVIGEAKGHRPLHLFDTFEGLPAPQPVDVGFTQGDYACSEGEVRAYLADLEGVHFHAGLFPGTSAPVREDQFSFVHLDVDLYQSTHDALTFFYPRLSVGAMLLSHDYVQFSAVRQAFDDYFAGRRQPVLELCGNQCLVVKIGAQNR